MGPFTPNKPPHFWKVYKKKNAFVGRFAQITEIYKY
jgi:hypothetical protein